MKRGCLTANPDIVGSGEASRMLGISQRLLCQWVDEGRISAWRIPGSAHRRLRRETVLEFAKANRMGEYAEAPDSEIDGLALAEVAKAVDMPLETVRRWIDEGRLASRQVGSTRRVKVDDLLEFCNAHEIRMRLA